MKLFIRQSFTQADNNQQQLVQSLMYLIESEYKDVSFLTGTLALNKNTFVEHFEQRNKIKFTPRSFRNHRLELIKQCDAMIFIRTSMSESGAFELAHNLSLETPKPVFYAHWINAPIKTTLLKDLADDYPVVYNEFDSAYDISKGLNTFFKKFELINFEDTLTN